MQQRVEQVPADRAGRSTCPSGSPDSGSGPGLLLIQEIYGVSDYIRAVAEDLAGLGYVVAAPDLFWRIKPRHEAAARPGRAARSRWPWASGSTRRRVCRDCLPRCARWPRCPRWTGGIGVIGFCLGGSIGYLVAAQAPVDVLISFYGSAVPDSLDLLSQISAPVQFHFGGSDPYIPRDRVRAVEEAAARYSRRAW